MRWLAQAAALLGAALLVLMAGGYLACPGGECRVPWFDAAGLAGADSLRSAGLDAAARAVTQAGSLPVLLPLAVLVAWADWRIRRRLDATLVPASLILAALVAHAAKTLFARPRPDLYPPLIDIPADGSFPSGHAMQAAAFVAALLLRPGARPALGWWFAGAGLVVAVVASRVYLQVHYPADVVAGAAAAVLLVGALRRLKPWRDGAEQDAGHPACCRPRGSGK